MTAVSPRAKLADLIARYGLPLAADPRRCEGLLGHGCETAAADEIAGLVAAADHAIPLALHRGASSSETRGALLDRLSRQLAQEAGLSDHWSRWSVECWALALRIVSESDDLMVPKLPRPLPPADEAHRDGQLEDRDVEPPLTKTPPPETGAAEAGALMARPTPRPPTSGLLARIMFFWRIAADKWVAGTLAGCLIAGAIAAVAVSSIRPGYVADGERRTYEAARGKPPALAVYIETCKVCAFADAARGEINRLQTEAEEHAYRSASGDPRALQTYVERCTVCAFKLQALDAIARLREEQIYRSARGRVDTLRAYLADCRICVFGDAARSELAELTRAADDERAYRSARGDLTALRAYVRQCGRCGFQNAALDEILRLEVLAVRPPAAPPDLVGVVRGASSAAVLYVVVSSRNSRIVPTRPGETAEVQLFGIVDPLGNSAQNPHVAALRNHLEDPQRNIECFVHEHRTFQCFAGGKDLAITALHDGIVRPAENTLEEYKQAAR